VIGGLDRAQRAWCLYDWANAVFKISVLTVFFSLYLTEVVQADARASGQACVSALRYCEVDFFGAQVQAGSVFGFLLAASTLVQVLVLPITGAIADRARNKRALLAGFAFAGALATCGLATVSGTSWRPGALLFAAANLCYYASITVYYAFLPEIATPDQRDDVSAKGWSVGYLGGGVCLAANIALVQGRDLLGLSQAGAIRWCFVFCGVWWAAFTVVGLRGLPERGAPERTEWGRALLFDGFRQLGGTLREVRRYPVTLLFLAAFLVFIDGVNTVAGSAGLYGQQELKLPVEVLTVTILAVQFIAFGGALVHGRLAARIGAKRTLLCSLAFWVLVVTAAYLIRPGDRLQFYAVAAGIGLVLAGPAALSRSIYSHLVPTGRVAEYYALYTLGERGTSSLGPLVFAVVANETGSFRPAILSLIAFLVIGFALVAVTPLRRGVREAGNPEPRLL
jgi:UMF1 family MFS transporter